jgi:hypothetical protein
VISKEQFFANSKLYPWQQDESYCISFCNRIWTKEVEKRIHRADEIVQQTYVFDLPWDMERTYDPVSFEGEIDWEYKPSLDMEFTYQFNRHSYFTILGQAYVITKEEKYARAFVTQITDWIEKNPLTEQKKITTWRSLEAGIRCANWIKTMGYFKDSKYFTEEVFHTILKSLEMHGAYINGSDTLFKLKSNWGIIENTGLLYLYAGLLGYEKGDYAYIIERLHDEAKVQILGDGVHWEQSPMYHNEVLHCYLEVLWLSQTLDIQLPNDLIDKIKKLAYVNLYWGKPNGCQFTTGDSDETCLKDMLVHSSYLLNDGVLKFAGFEQMDYDGIWSYGKEGSLLYEKIRPIKHDYTHCSLKESGNYYIRSSWDENANVLHFKNGSLGNGHGHNDKLHVDLVLNGEDVLIDSGRYSYVYDKTRVELKSSLSHNTVTVDGLDYMDYLDSWGVCGLAPYWSNALAEQKEYVVVQGGHGGYISKLGSYINRKVIAIDSNVFILVDELYGSSKHTYAGHFHFNDQGNTVIDNNNIYYHGERVCAKFTVLSDEVTIKKEKTVLSKHYNLKTEKDTIIVEKEVQDCGTMIMVMGENYEASKVNVLQSDGIRVLDPKYASGIRIKTKEHEYLILICHQDMAEPSDLMIAENLRGELCKGMGRIVIFRDEEIVGGSVFHS